MEPLAIGRDPNFRALAATGMIEGNIVAGSVVGRASSMLGILSTVAVAAGSIWACPEG
jgi:hypothetical protein